MRCYISLTMRCISLLLKAFRRLFCVSEISSLSSPYIFDKNYYFSPTFANLVRTCDIKKHSKKELGLPMHNYFSFPFRRLLTEIFISSFEDKCCSYSHGCGSSRIFLILWKVYMCMSYLICWYSSKSSKKHYLQCI